MRDPSARGDSDKPSEKNTPRIKRPSDIAYEKIEDLPRVAKTDYGHLLDTPPEQVEPAGTSEDSEDDVCKGYGHSYYKPGGNVKYSYRNIFKRGNPSRHLYSRIPVADDTRDHNDEDQGSKVPEKVKPMHSEVHCRKNLARKHPGGCRPKTHRTHTHEPNCVGAPKLKTRQYFDEESPIASSSRNTSIDYSDVFVQKQKSRISKHDETYKRGAHWQHQSTGHEGHVELDYKKLEARLRIVKENEKREDDEKVS